MFFLHKKIFFSNGKKSIEIQRVIELYAVAVISYALVHSAFDNLCSLPLNYSPMKRNISK